MNRGLKAPHGINTNCIRVTIHSPMNRGLKENIEGDFLSDQFGELQSIAPMNRGLKVLWQLHGLGRAMDCYNPFPDE